MAGVTDDKANVVLASKVHSSDDLIAGGDVDSVADVVAQRARLGLGRERITCLVGKVGLHHRRRGVKAKGN